MPKCIVLADDLTGANGAGVLLRKLRLRVLTLLSLEHAGAEELAKYDAVLHPTDSRNCPPEEAYKKVSHAVGLLNSEDTVLYSKRIDSTFRGNVGAEINALLDGMEEGTVAVVVPAFPTAGRVCRDGCLFIDGVPLDCTDAGRDAKAPVSTSSTLALLQKQTSRRVQAVNTDCVAAGSAAVAQAIRQGAAEGIRIFLVDAENEEDIAVIAEGAVLSDVPFVAADPGPFTAAVAARIDALFAKTMKGKILLAIGSITDTTRRQVEYMRQNFNVYAAEIDVQKLLESEESYSTEIGRVLGCLEENYRQYGLLAVLLSTLWPEKRVDFAEAAQRLGCTPEAVSRRVNEAVAKISTSLLAAHTEIRGIYSSGGDVTAALCRRLGATGLELKEEVIPLAAYGILVGGRAQGWHIVTKGGIVGDETTAAVCLEYLQGKLKVNGLIEP